MPSTPDKPNPYEPPQAIEEDPPTAVDTSNDKSWSEDKTRDFQTILLLISMLILLPIVAIILDSLPE